MKKPDQQCFLRRIIGIFVEFVWDRKWKIITKRPIIICEFSLAYEKLVL